MNWIEQERKIKDFCIFNYAFLSLLLSLIIIMILLPKLKILRFVHEMFAL